MVNMLFVLQSTWQLLCDHKCKSALCQRFSRQGACKWRVSRSSTL